MLSAKIEHYIGLYFYHWIYSYIYEYRYLYLGIYSIIGILIHSAQSTRVGREQSNNGVSFFFIPMCSIYKFYLCH